MSANMDDAGNAPKKKSSEIHDLSTDALTDEENGADEYCSNMRLTRASVCTCGHTPADATCADSAAARRYTSVQGLVSLPPRSETWSAAFW